MRLANLPSLYIGEIFPFKRRPIEREIWVPKAIETPKNGEKLRQNQSQLYIR